MEAPVAIVHRVIAIPELAANVFQFLWSSQIHRLRLVSKFFNDACLPLVSLALKTNEFSDNQDVQLLVQTPSSRNLITSYKLSTSFLKSLEKLGLASPRASSESRASAIDNNGNSGNSDYKLSQVDLTWLAFYESLPWVRSITFDVHDFALEKLDHFLAAIAAHTPGLTSVTIESSRTLGFKAFIRSLDAWPRLKALSLEIDILHVDREEDYEVLDQILKEWREQGSRKLYPSVHTLEIYNADISSDFQQLLLSLFPNIRDFRYAPISLHSDGFMEQDTANDQIRGAALDDLKAMNAKNTTLLFPDLIHLRAIGGNLDDFEALRWVLGDRPAHVDDKRGIRIGHQLRSLDLVAFYTTADGLIRLSTLFGEYGVSFRQLRLDLWDSQDINLKGFLTSSCCRELTELRCTADCIFMEPTEVFEYEVLAPVGQREETQQDDQQAIQTIQTIQATQAEGSVMTAPTALVPEYEPIPESLIDSFAWTRTLTTLHLDERACTAEGMKTVTKLIKSLPKLVELSMNYALMDLMLFDGLGKDLEPASLQPSPQEEQGAQRRSGELFGALTDLGSESDLRLQEDLNQERPFLEKLSLRLDSRSKLAEEEAKVLIRQKFRFMEVLEVTKDGSFGEFPDW
ncbi:hypothetical protein BC939DRAFT_35967 [Gamsiella multidivaricata]|uniref:uncharacterized protein n=1 Tax=Gamsiella multidivaricata TaxID=101098 RepID=UPI0022204602|nr:uncharacterized protein BC939DRAFT_35967 [Gamsiella multidivaricata]KAG0362732.1 hypothetical protein BGZ54_008500 [Gamsiella multidivaricata]KAI7816583.1 hypothetical protein BC939DRAFT_35967 [Gamsiella multidivaricata]